MRTLSKHRQSPSLRPQRGLGLSAGSFVAALAMTGCVDQRLGSLESPPESTLNRLRVLAVQSDPPDLVPGESATLRALVFAPTDAPLDYRWSWCPVRGTGTEDFECSIRESELEALWMQLGLPGVAPAYALGRGAEAEFVNPFTEEAILALCSAISSGAAELANFVDSCSSGFEISIRLEVALDGQSEVALKDVTLVPEETPTASRNNNPSPLGSFHVRELFTNQVVEDAGLELGGIYRVRFNLDAALSEEILPADPQSGETLNETLVMSWFTTVGAPAEVLDDQADLDELAEDANPQGTSDRVVYLPGTSELEDIRQRLWILPRQTDATEGSIVAVLRDDRGGVAWSELNVSLLEAP